MMRANRIALVLSAVLLGAGAADTALPPPPVAKQIPVTDTYYGTTIVDPYRWMESGGPELEAYLRAHNARTRTILNAIPGRAAFSARVQALSQSWVVSSGVVSRHGRRFYMKLPPHANSMRLYVRPPNGNERVLVDPDAMSGPRQAISYFNVSNDGKYVAYGLSPGGSENATVHVVEAASGKVLPDASDRADFGVVSWSDQGDAFYYLRRQELAAGASALGKYQNIRTYRHVIGTPSSADVAVFGAGVNPRFNVPPSMYASLGVSPESPYLAGVLANGVDPFVTVYTAPKSALKNPARIRWRLLIRPEDKIANAVIHGDTVYALTARNAPRYKIVKFNVHGSAERALDVIPAGTRIFDDLANAGDAVYVKAREDGLGRIVRIGFDGSVRDIAVPVNGTIKGFATEYDRPGFLAQFASWTTSPRWYAYDVEANRLADTTLDPPSPVDFSGIVADEVKVKAADGTPIPLSIVHRRDIKLDGSNPTVLYAYGAYGIPVSPSFVPTRMAWFEQGGIFAVAHVRGGGEYGEEWHLAGKDANKARSAGDFVDCARWLVENGYTSPAKLAARGGSAGSIPIGGALVGAPSLFAAILDEVPVADQLRIEMTANGPPNIPEFGSVKTEQGFKNLYATSVYHHLHKGTKYPAVMVTTGINDPRVEPWEAAKMTAALQDATASGKPILLRVDFEGGHGLIGSGRSQQVSLTTDEYTFLLWQFGVPGFQPEL